jgi:DNA-binding MarR family transcriptional regulator
MSVKAPGSANPGVDVELHELMTLMGRVMPALKRGGSPPPAAFVQAAQLLQDAVPEGEHGSLGPRHGPLLVVVAIERDLSVSELAARVGLSVSTVSLMVGELSRAGLVERLEDDRDRRRTLVRLHPDHAEELEAWMRERLAPLRRTLERLDPVAREHFLDGWRLLAEESGALGPAGDPGEADCGG